MAPSIAPKELADIGATLAENCYFSRGRVDPLRDILDIQGATLNDDSIFYYNGAWELNQNTDYVGVLLPQDVLSRVYYTDNQYPKIRSGGSSFRLGVPRPSFVPTTTVDVTGDITNNQGRNQSYIISFVDVWGREGPLTDPTASVTVGVGGQVTLSLSGPPTGNYNFGSGALIRVYRSLTGSVETDYQFIGETLITSPTFVDNLEPEQAGEVAPSAEWIGPPDDDSNLYPNGPLQGLVELPTGSLAGFSGNQVCVSLPGLPHAWPLRYRFSTSAPVVGLAVIQTGVVVLTQGRLHFLSGLDVESMVMVRLDSSEACMSRQSIVDMGSYVIYAGDDGLMRVDGGGVAENITRAFITPEDWRATYQPSTIRAFRSEDRYTAFFGDIDDGTGFIFDYTADTAALSHISGRVNSGWFDYVGDRSVVIYKDVGDNWRLGEFNAGATLTGVWKGKQNMYPFDLGFNFVRCEADSYPVLLTATVNGVEQPSLSIPNASPHRLPWDFLSRDWQVQLDFNSGVDFFGMWDSIAEVV